MQNLSKARAALVCSLHRRKGRVEHNAYLAEGERLVAELTARQRDVRFAFATPDRVEWLQSVLPWVECCVVGRDTRRVFATEHAQGVGAVVVLPPPVAVAELLGAPGPALYLDRLADPGNVGTVLRTADWFGIRSVLLSDGTADPYGPKAVRASMGALLRMVCASEARPDDLAAAERPVVAMDAGGHESLGAAELPMNGVYVIGSEAHGVHEDILRTARRVAIPGAGAGESLNAAVAAGILLYELYRRMAMAP